MKVKFKINEIIVIIMALLEEFETKEVFGIENEEDRYFPKPINNKLNMLNEQEYKDFFLKAEEVVESVYLFKSGELNELNAIHEEINILANDILRNYLY